MTITVRRLAAVLLAGVLLFTTACSGDDASEDSASDAAGGADAEEALTGPEVDGDAGADQLAEGESAAGAGEAAPPDAGPIVDPAVAAEGRQIISTAQIQLQVDDLATAAQRLERLVARANGFVFGEDTDLRQGARTRIVIKVPPSRFRSLLADLGELGDVATQTISTDDVTDQVVDLDSRIATAEASVFRLRALLAEATVVPDIADIENQLLQRETELERLRGQRRTIENQVSLATITAVLRSERTTPPPPPEPEDPQAGFFDGLRGGASALKTFAVGASAVAGALLPWLPLFLLAGFVAWRLHRRRPVAG